MNKKVLLIMPRFFDYPQVIVEELKNMGYEVDFFDDRPSTNAWIKAAIRINKKLIQRYIQSYFQKIMLTVKANVYDVVFLISGQSLSFDEDMIREIRESQKQAVFVLYQWDSEKNFPYIVQMQKFFDRCYSFDREDSNIHENMEFLPLFYSRTYEEIGLRTKTNYQYDFCFVGTAHPKKYKFINMMTQQLKPVFPSQFIYFFFPSRIVYFYRKAMNTELRHSRYSEFHYTPLGKDDMIRIYDNTKCVLDSGQDGQTGLTIRIIEALGSKKKIITTNEDVKNYDFYNECNILIFDGKIDRSAPFFTEPYRDIATDVYEKYALRNWLRTMFE